MLLQIIIPKMEFSDGNLERRYITYWSVQPHPLNRILDE